MMRDPVRRSPRNRKLNTMTQIGEVNSSANTCASGMEASAKNQGFCPVKWNRLRKKCCFSRARRISPSLRLAAARDSTMTRPTSERKVMISNVLCTAET